jgi:hypothetical protein
MRSLRTIHLRCRTQRLPNRHRTCWVQRLFRLTIGRDVPPDEPPLVWATAARLREKAAAATVVSNAIMPGFEAKPTS